MISISIKKLFRRCLLIVLIGVATGCTSIKQMPSSPVVVQERSFNTITTIIPELPETETVSRVISNLTPQVLEVPSKDLVLETPAQYGNLVDYISKRFKVSEMTSQNIIMLASKYASYSFPKRNDILAIIAVESGYNTGAKFRGCYGLMQVKKASHNKTLKGRSLYTPQVNIEVGSGVLEEYYGILKDNKATVLAFNSGIGNYQKRKYKLVYYNKYLTELKLISKL